MKFPRPFLGLRPLRRSFTDIHHSESRRAEIAARPRGFYPRLGSVRTEASLLRIPHFVAKYDAFRFESVADRRVPALYQLEGRVMSVRKAGKALYFLDLLQDDARVQIYASNRQMQLSTEKFHECHAMVRAHDYVSCVGHPFQTKVGQLSLLLLAPLRIVSPCLRSTTLPEKLSDRGLINADRVMNYLVSPAHRERVVVRSLVTQAIREYLLADGFLEVQTPLLASAGTGATAEPFYSTLKAVSGHKLLLRVAPELWLKRLVVGGFEKVFEIGPSFRNEGIDATHNPEFTTCEFYRLFTSLPDLMHMTQQLLQNIYARLELQRAVLGVIRAPLERFIALKNGMFPKYEFIPTIERETGVLVPETLSSDNLVVYLQKVGVPVPDQKQPAALLDRLSEVYLESLSHVHKDMPVFIYNQPAEMSPLAKSGTVVYDGRAYDISLRFELFINGMEYVNAYEEENLPFAQEAKFRQQQSYKDDFDDAESLIPDWNYVHTMEYGLPPTGGWGCGIDRLSMLFSDSARIEDVLSFGTLRDVVKQ